MYVNIRRSVDCVSFQEVAGGDLFVYEGAVYIKLKVKNPYNAVNLETGWSMSFDPNAPVVVPDVAELTIDL